MVATPTRPAKKFAPPVADNPADNQLAKQYIQNLAKGIRPTQRPENFGEWDRTIENIEHVYNRSNGDTEKIKLVIDALSRYNMHLADLLAPAPLTIEEVWKEDELSPDYPPLPASAVLPPDASCGASSWLDDYVAFSKKASPEGYEEFHVFAGLWLQSVVAARRVYLPLGRKRIHGNLMLGFCADTSLYAKSTTAFVAKDVLEAAGLSHLLGPDRVTPQRLLSLMSGRHIPSDYGKLSPETKEHIRKKLSMPGQVGLLYDELGKFIMGMLRKGSSNADFADLLLTLDGCPKQYENSTITRGSEPVQKPYLPILGSMVPNNLKENARSGADFWTDGFWARFSFIVAPQGEYLDCPLDAEELPIPGQLITKIQAWHNRLGVPECTLDAILDKYGNETDNYTINREELPEKACSIADDALAAWKHYRSALKKALVTFTHKDFHGSYSRLPETALRIAVLLASLESSKNRIEMKHWAKAQELTEILRKNLHELYKQVNASSFIDEAAKTENNIIEKMQNLTKKGVDGITVAQLKGSYFKNLSYDEIRKIFDGLVKAGRCEMRHTAHARSGKYYLLEQTE